MIEHSTNVNANCTIKKAIVSILGDDACSLIKIFPIPTIEQWWTPTEFLVVVAIRNVGTLQIWSFEHWKWMKHTTRYRTRILTFQWMNAVLLPCCVNLISALPFSTLQTLSGSLSHRLSNTVNIEAAAGPPTLNSHCFSSCCPTTLLHRRYRQSPPVGRRRRAKLTRSNRHIQASGNVA